MEKSNSFTDIQLKHQQEMREKRDKLRQRKERTHRLIVRGAIAENAIEGSTDMTDEEFQTALLRIVRRVNAAASHPQDPHGSARREAPSEDPAEQPSAERTRHAFA